MTLAEMRIKAASLLTKAENIVDALYARILVVDGNGSTLDLLKNVLENYFSKTKIEALIATNSKEALAAAEDSRVKVALVDYYLGDGDSKHLCKKLKKMGVPVCMMTGDNDNEAIVRFCKDHEIPLIHKPFSIPILHRAVDKFILKKTA